MGSHCLIFIEENPSIHMANLRNKWYKQYGIKKMNWSAHSSNLNPIKNIWEKNEEFDFEIIPTPICARISGCNSIRIGGCALSIIGQLTLVNATPNEDVGPTSY
ncbi:hypothetical protein O181_032888 [Austropuccinia psidii MF-1]|uniref:Uncharacterized protein n=1 Tax=Austropuccinia psidii MF-1 TaxID=1389203 RepID=A0A9Q3D0D5_9BASI|nr:hypothetical protein [Austropuccinia psidii MF-1]